MKTTEERIEEILKEIKNVYGIDDDTILKLQLENLVIQAQLEYIKETKI